jgi:hypothetical protein
MGKYKAKPFTVTILWFEGNGVRKRRFRKYIEAVEWASKYLDTDEIVVRIILSWRSQPYGCSAIGTIEKEEGADGN